MREFNKIFGVGMPRCGGQSLQRALNILFPDKRVYHSPLPDAWDDIASEDCLGAVEVFAPFNWLNQAYPNSLYIWNVRLRTEWLDSCRRVLPQSQGWNHPMWGMPPGAWTEARSLRWYELDSETNDRVLTHRVTGGWNSLCTFLDCPIPDVPYPNIDKVGR